MAAGAQSDMKPPLDEGQSAMNPVRPRPPSKKQVRLPPADRENMILEAATDFFANNGFSGQTRDLAIQIGISQSLIFRYFSSKDALLEKVYQRVFLTRWSPFWTENLQDRSRPIRQRLKEFYRIYLAAVDDPRWVRIVMYSSLAGRDLARRWMSRVVETLLGVIAEEINVEFSFSQSKKINFEVVWFLHSIFIYWLIRKHIHCTRTFFLTDELVDLAVDNFLDGICERATPAVRDNRASQQPLDLGLRHRRERAKSSGR